MAALPNHSGAVIDDRKITDYLLSGTHPTGRAKAAFFTSFGFRAEVPDELKVALLGHAAGNDVVEAQVTSYGTKYAIDGPLESPDGRNPKVRVVWFVDAGTDQPRLVTAFPG